MRTHDGVYFRSAFGGGFGEVKSEGLGLTSKYTGGGWLLDLYVGGTFGNLVVVGGSLMVMSILYPDVELSDGLSTVQQGTSGRLGIVAIGPFADLFFDPHGGGHVGALIGAASIGLEDENEQPSSGYGVSLFGGYDFWVAEQWALGIEGRYSYAHCRRRFPSVDATFEDRANTFGLMFTALHH